MNVSSIGYSDYAVTTPTATETIAAGQVPAQRQLAQAGRAINQSGILGRNQIVFSTDSQTHQRVVLIEDKETHEVVQQIPPEYLLELAQNLGGPSSETKAE